MNKIIIGTLAGIGTTFSFLPQVYHVFKNNTIDGLSPYMMIVHFSGTGLWIIYGFLQSDNVIIAFNTITITFVASIFFKYLDLKNRTQPNSLTNV